jgi:PHD/YefM family antitoxin component YafN of YafNO toxin-antitoxin module
VTIELTEKQQTALDARGDELPQIVDPRTNATYVLVAAEEYESIREIIEDERRQRAIRAVALRNAAGRMDDAP